MIFSHRLYRSDTHDSLLCKRCKGDGEEEGKRDEGQCQGTKKVFVGVKAPKLKESCNDIGGFAAASRVKDRLESHHRQVSFRK